MNDATQFEPRSSEGTTFEPKILAYVCNWCTYLGADLAGTTRAGVSAEYSYRPAALHGPHRFQLAGQSF